MTRTNFKSDISKTGAFFTHDPGKTFTENLDEMLHTAARVGAQDVRGRMGTGRAPISALGGHVADYVIGIVRDTTMVVMVRNRGLTAKQAISLMAAASEVEKQSGAFRKSAARLRSARVVNVAELLKGIQ